MLYGRPLEHGDILLVIGLRAIRARKGAVCGVFHPTLRVVVRFLTVSFILIVPAEHGRRLHDGRHGTFTVQGKPFSHMCGGCTINRARRFLYLSHDLSGALILSSVRLGLYGALTLP